MSFRGHDESTGSLNNGNYRELLECFGKFDSVFQRRLHGRLEKFEGVFSRVSADIQNDLIESIDALIQDQIDREVEECTFISIQVDETTEQVNTNIRLDKKEVIVERFLKFYITAIIKDLFKKYGSSIQKKFSMQTYDGASVMSGHISAAQTLVREETLMHFSFTVLPIGLILFCASQLQPFLLSRFILQMSVHSVISPV